MQREILEDNDWGEGKRQESLKASPTWSTPIIDGTVPPGSNVPSLSNYDVYRDRSSHEVETQISVKTSTPTDPGIYQRFDSESEWEEVIDSDEQTTA